MRTLGLIGGMSWYSTEVYYRAINEGVQQRAPGRSARILLHSIDIHDYKPLQERNDMPGITALLGDVAERLERGGAEVIALCSNTPHAAAEGIAGRVTVPFLHIADATADAIAAQGLSTVCLLGTRVTMDADFFPGRLAERGIRMMLPDAAERAFVHASIVDELTQGRFTEATRQCYLEIIDRSRKHGAQGVILGCTEIGLLLPEDACPVPAFDTALVHANALVRFALG
ncbi:MAG TPA: amino acid racemase [Flavobacteriales bacterium]